MLRLLLIASVLLCASAMRKEARGIANVKGGGGLAGPPLCDESIVQETCMTLNDGDDSSSVTLEALQSSLAATTASAEKFWKALNLEESTSVPCMDLCHSTVTALRNFGATVPGTSDVGCYSVDSEVVCDLPLDFASIKALIKTQVDLPNFHEVAQPKIVQEKRSFKRKPGDTGPKDGSSIEYPVWEAARRVANLFRIYPMDETLVNDGQETDSMLEEKSTDVIDVVIDPRGRKVGVVLFSSPSVKVKSVVPGGVADQAGVKVNDEFMLDPNTLRYYLKTGQYFSCRIRRESLPGRSYSPGSGSTPQWKRDLMQRNQQAQVYVTNALHKLRARQTQRHITKWFGSAAFTDNTVRQELTRVLNSLDALLDNVEYVYPGPQCKPNVYGYVYPRHPDASKVKDRAGKYIFYLCDTYMNAKIGEQIETLTHEGSHHATAFTTDVCVDGLRTGQWPQTRDEARSQWPDQLEIGEYYDQTIRGRRTTVQIVQITPTTVKTEVADFDRDCQTVGYGRETCQSLARANPFQALRNADNLCYYIQDITDAS